MEYLWRDIHQETGKEDRKVGETLGKRGVSCGAHSMETLLIDVIPDGEKQKDGEGVMRRAVPERITTEATGPWLEGIFSVTAGDEEGLWE